MKILFICTGNTCRSPMAEGLFRKKAAERGLAAYVGASAGLCAGDGSPAALNAIEACREVGVDLSGHLSRYLSPELVEETDLFAVMTRNHAAVLRSAGIPEAKIHVLGEGIPDPFGGDIEQYRMTRDSLAAALDALLADLSGRENKENTGGNLDE